MGSFACSLNVNTTVKLLNMRHKTSWLSLFWNCIHNSNPWDLWIQWHHCKEKSNKSKEHEQTQQVVRTVKQQLSFGSDIKVLKCKNRKLNHIVSLIWSKIDGSFSFPCTLSMVRTWSLFTTDSLIDLTSACSVTSHQVQRIFSLLHLTITKKKKKNQKVNIMF